MVSCGKRGTRQFWFNGSGDFEGAWRADTLEKSLIR